MLNYKLLVLDKLIRNIIKQNFVKKKYFYQNNRDKHLKDKFNMIVKKIIKLSSKG